MKFYEKKDYQSFILKVLWFCKQIVGSRKATSESSQNSIFYFLPFFLYRRKFLVLLICHLFLTQGVKSQEFQSLSLDRGEGQFTLSSKTSANYDFISASDKVIITDYGHQDILKEISLITDSSSSPAVSSKETRASMQAACASCSIPTNVPFNGLFINAGGSFLVSDNLNFVDTRIIGTDRTSPFATVLFMSNATWSQASNTGFVDGYVQKIVTSTFVFPVGDNGVYRPIQISDIQTEGTFTAAYFGVNPSSAITSSLTGGNYSALPSSDAPFNSNMKASSVQNVSEVEYWDINGIETCKITLTYNPCSNVSTLTTSDLTKLSIAGWSNAEKKWIIIPSTIDIRTFDGLTSTLCEGSISTNANIRPNDYSVFTLASKAVATVVPNFSNRLKLGTNQGSKNENAILELEATRMGLLLPKVGLTNSTSISPMSGTVFSSAVPGGMLVYNTSTQNDIQAGCYISDGVSWGKLVSVGNDVLKLGVSNPNVDGSLPINAAVITATTNIILPTATTGLGGTIYFIRNMATTTNITVSNLINFGATVPVLFLLTPAQGAVTVVCDGINWYRIN
jgi:hypothetical protein